MKLRFRIFPCALVVKRTRGESVSVPWLDWAPASPSIRCGAEILPCCSFNLDSQTCVSAARSERTLSGIREFSGADSSLLVATAGVANCIHNAITEIAPMALREGFNVSS